MKQDHRNGSALATVRRLPNKWELIVQLVGTFGLAVFLVLYYVVFVQPREARRYDELRRSVDSVLKLAQSGQTLVTREQAERLKELFILSAAPELTRYLQARLDHETGNETVSAADAHALTVSLSENLHEILIVRSHLLRGFSRDRDDDLAELLGARLTQSGVANQIADRAVKEWPYRAQLDLERMCRESLYGSLRSFV